MRLFIVFCTLFGPTLAALGFDSSKYQTNQSINCMKNQGYQFYASRVYHSYGAADDEGIKYVKWAIQSGFKRVDAFFFPCAHSGCPTPANQVQTCSSALNAAGVSLHTLWVDIESLSWSTNLNTNRNFIMAITQNLDAARINWGIYTNKEFWKQIVGVDWDYYKNKPLWWTRFNWAADLTTNWENFGGWTKPEVHQYQQDITGPCGFIFDPDYLIL